MATKPSPSPDVQDPSSPSLGAALPTAPTTAQAPLRCIQRPTGEWFTFAVGNPPGRDTPDAVDLLTEAEARARLRERGVLEAAIEETLATARGAAEISGDVADWNAPPGGAEG